MFTSCAFPLTTVASTTKKTRGNTRWCSAVVHPQCASHTKCYGNAHTWLWPDHFLDHFLDHFFPALIHLSSICRLSHLQHHNHQSFCRFLACSWLRRLFRRSFICLSPVFTSPNVMASWTSFFSSPTSTQNGKERSQWSSSDGIHAGKFVDHTWFRFVQRCRIEPKIGKRTCVQLWKHATNVTL